MRVFQKPNLFFDWKCPICKTKSDEEVVLIGIEGTEDAHNIQAEQVHLRCLDLRWNQGMNIIYQNLNNDGVVKEEV